MRSLDLDTRTAEIAEERGISLRDAREYAQKEIITRVKRACEISINEGLSPEAALIFADLEQRWKR